MKKKLKKEGKEALPFRPHLSLSLPPQIAIYHFLSSLYNGDRRCRLRHVGRPIYLRPSSVPRRRPRLSRPLQVHLSFLSSSLQIRALYVLHSCNLSSQVLLWPSYNQIQGALICSPHSITTISVLIDLKLKHWICNWIRKCDETDVGMVWEIRTVPESSNLLSSYWYWNALGSVPVTLTSYW